MKSIECILGFPKRVSHYLQRKVFQAIQKFNYWLASKRYSHSTIKTYSEALKSFLIFHRELSISEITNEDVITYNNEFI
ncbi:phage integrase N-terminal SAM-like domain-containing protein [Flavobacterium piscis]|uniref:phage integrase N-terminal SAM-like domain-containing protein n=1 Tax=Flavobacterium piscis TaxID=1114874 RepID=UPI0038D3C0B9